MRNLIDVWLTWETCVLDPKCAMQLSTAVQHILDNKKRYEAVGKMFGIPWWVIGAIHYRESSGDFTTWLANGDPLMRHGRPVQTLRTPKGLGPAPNWEEAAMLSLQNLKWHSGMDWDLISALCHLERYNGMGYLRAGILSPYLWSGTSHYSSGKFRSDGLYDPGLVDQQSGCAALALGLKMSGVDLQEKKYV